MTRTLGLFAAPVALAGCGADPWSQLGRDRAEAEALAEQAERARLEAERELVNAEREAIEGRRPGTAAGRHVPREEQDRRRAAFERGAAGEPLEIVDVFVGIESTLALLSDGSVRVWGCNRQGILGIGIADDADTAVPVRPAVGEAVVQAPAPFALLAVGGGAWTTACAVDAEGEAWCWGAPQLVPDGAAIRDWTVRKPNGEAMLTRPTPVASLAHARSIALSDALSCAVIPTEVLAGALQESVRKVTGGLTSTQGQVVCWFPHDDPADPLAWRSGAPRAIELPVQVKTVSAGGRHACAIAIDGRVFCWGVGAHGEVDGVPAGPATTSDAALVGHAALTGKTAVLGPRAVPGVDGAVAVAAAEGLSCALTHAGLQCWGHTFYGRGAVTVPLPGARQAAALIGGIGEMCVLDDHGAVRCMPTYARADCIASVHTEAEAKACGEGKLAHDPATLVWSAPQGAAAREGLRVVSLGFDGTWCAAGSSGTNLICAGNNEHGQLGDGTRASQREPVPVGGWQDVRASVSAPVDLPLADEADARLPAPDELPAGCVAEPMEVTFAGEPAQSIVPLGSWAQLDDYSLSLDLRSRSMAAADWPNRSAIRGAEVRVSVTMLDDRGRKPGDSEFISPELVRPGKGTYKPLPPGKPGRVVSISIQDLHRYEGIAGIARALVTGTRRPSVSEGAAKGEGKGAGKVEGGDHDHAHDHGSLPPETETHLIREQARGHATITAITAGWICGELDLAQDGAAVRGKFAARRL